VHHLIYVPSLEAAEKLTSALARIGNLSADGRPILGLDSRDLLELALGCHDAAFLVPAHIWTPWFAVLGSKSGFDSVTECYRDLAGHIFAVETGLSSDPPMNWRLRSLDGYTLVSNSDAHSPAKLGREACRFDCALGYAEMRNALQTGAGWGGTVEFFPEEGKYHLDGHRSCAVRLVPEETRAADGRCPTCGRPVTVGVMHRVAALADRPAGARPARAAPFVHLLPLAEVLGELLGVGPASRAVTRAYDSLLARVGPELYVLENAPLEDLRRQGSTLLAEAVSRMRAGQVICDAGYDGAYGVVRVFQPGELTDGAARPALFAVDAASPALDLV
jgi:DNA helicase-2/ATP-dependent DNA helicase PcrA